MTTPRIDFVRGGFWADNPHEGLAWLRRHKPVCFDEASGVWGITLYEHVREISRNPETFSSANGIRPESGPVPMMIDMDDPAHWKRRKLVNKGFTPQRVRDLEGRITEIVDGLIDAVADRERCDFVWDIAAWLPLIVIGDALGAEQRHHADLLRWSDDLMRGLGTSDPELLAKMSAAFEEYRAYLIGVIEARREKARDDIISVLVHAEIDNDRLDDDELTYETLLILIGGDETTRHVITGGAYQLLSVRERWERLASDRSLLPSAVEEMLRWVTPIKNMARTATRDVEFYGELIREGQKMLLLYPSANRDEDQFPDPFSFDIERSPNDHVAFGVGTHFCLGASLARIELKVLFDRVLDRLPGLRLAESDEPASRPANFVSGYETMPVTLS